MSRYTVVDGFVPAAPSELDDVRGGIWSYALDQRAFGPRKLWVVFTDAGGTFTGLAYTDRVEEWGDALAACVQHLGAGAAAAIVLQDEPVADAPSPEFGNRFAEARRLMAAWGVHLVDWIACDDDRYCAARLTAVRSADQPDWWDVPARAATTQ